MAGRANSGSAGAKFKKMIDYGAAIDSVKKSSKSELSSRFFGRLKFFRSAGGIRKTIFAVGRRYSEDDFFGRPAVFEDDFFGQPSWDGLRERHWPVPGGAQTFMYAPSGGG